MKQLRLFPRPTSDERARLEHDLLHGKIESLHTWPTKAEPSEQVQGRRLLVLGALPKPPAEMTGAELDEFCLAFARRLNAQRDAYLDALADPSRT